MWPERATVPFLPADAIHLWYVGLDGLAERADAMRDVLSPDEAARAGRFRFERDRVRFIAGRGVLRHLLASYVGAPSARDITLRYGAFGKPALASSGAQVRFNLAHSGPHALLGVTRAVEIGVDVELIHDISDMDALTRACFGREERRQLTALASSSERVHGFFRGWTRKEAVLKALGSGLSRSLDSFEVSIADEHPSLLRMDGDASPRAWRLLHLVPAPGCIGAAAWIGPELRAACFSYAA